MSNIEKIRQEIERRINAYKTKNGFPAGTKCAIRIETYEGLLAFIDSLPEEKPLLYIEKISPSPKAQSELYDWLLHYEGGLGIVNEESLKKFYVK